MYVYFHTNSGILFLEVILWGIFIVLLLLNGARYFFGISVNASIKKLFSNEPEMDFIIKKSAISANPADARVERWTGGETVDVAISEKDLKKLFPTISLL